MSISALTSGTSGLTANQRALDVAANNIANANTPGFQPQSANFQEASPRASRSPSKGASWPPAKASAAPMRMRSRRPKAGRTASAWRPN
jgi:flagellar basal body rod protein FlgG